MYLFAFCLLFVQFVHVLGKPAIVFSVKTFTAIFLSMILRAYLDHDGDLEWSTIFSSISSWTLS